MKPPNFNLGDRVETIEGDHRFIVSEMRWNAKAWHYRATYAGYVEEKYLRLLAGEPRK